MWGGKKLLTSEKKEGSLEREERNVSEPHSRSIGEGVCKTERDRQRQTQTRRERE